MKSHFDKAQVAGLAKKYKLKSEFRNYQLIDQIELCAEIYFRHKRGMDHHQPIKSLRKELEEISSLTKRLRDKLTAHDHPDDLDGGAQYAMHQVARGFAQEALYQEIPNEGNTPVVQVPLSHGLQATINRADDRSTIHFIYEIQDILIALTHLETYASIAKTELRKDSPGRRTSYALKSWAANMEILWRNFNGSAFTLTRINGVIKSPSALFAMEALTLIDPEEKETSMANAIRAHISKRRKA